MPKLKKGDHVWLKAFEDGEDSIPAQRIVVLFNENGAVTGMIHPKDRLPGQSDGLTEAATDQIDKKKGAWEDPEWDGISDARTTPFGKFSRI